MPDRDAAHSTPRCRKCGYELTGLRVEEACPECGTRIWPTPKELAAWAGEISNVLSDATWLAIGAVPFLIVLPPLGMLITVAAMHSAWTVLRIERTARGTRGRAAQLLLVATGVELVAGVVWLWAVLREFGFF